MTPAKRTLWFGWVVLCSCLAGCGQSAGDASSSETKIPLKGQIQFVAGFHRGWEMAHAQGKPIQVGGTNTSPGWAAILQQAATKELPLAYDSTGANPADHTSFYQKNIPVLYFNTGGADGNKINYEGTLDVLKLVYNIIDKTSKDKLAFSKAD